MFLLTCIFGFSSVMAGNVPSDEVIESPNQISGAVEKLLAELAYNKEHVDSRITDSAFPGLDPNVSIDGVRSVNFGRKFGVHEVDSLLAVQGLKSVRPDKAMRWVAANQDKRPKSTFVAFGQMVAKFDGRYDGVLVLVGFDGERYAIIQSALLGWEIGWAAFYNVLAEPMTPNELSAWEVKHK